MSHVENSNWSDWFNSQQTSKYTTHAVLTNTIEDQRAFFLSLHAQGRLALLITKPGDKEPIGVISLSGVDFRQRTAAIAIVMDTETEKDVPLFGSLEAMSAMTQHAFQVMGLNRLDAGQVYPALLRWNRLLELLGYRAEGFKRQAFSRGHEVSDVVILSCLNERFVSLAEKRGGTLWPGSQEMKRLLMELPRKSFAELLDESHRALEAMYFGDFKG